MAEALPKDGDALLFEEGLTPDGVRRLADAVMQGRSGRAAVFAGTDAGGYAYAIGQVSGDLRGLTRELNACLNGRGGGKPASYRAMCAQNAPKLRRFGGKRHDSGYFSACISQ